ncbi:MAG: hypothetical protein ABH872_00610 [Candidatus Omnitrophota bacterium]
MLQKMKKSQSTLEYALLIGVVVGALLTMQTYIKRSIQGRLVTVGDQIGDQYSPDLTKRNEHMLVTNDRVVEATTGGVAGFMETTVEGGRTESQTRREVSPLDQETFVE